MDEYHSFLWDVTEVSIGSFVMVEATSPQGFDFDAAMQRAANPETITQDQPSEGAIKFVPLSKSPQTIVLHMCPRVIKVGGFALVRTLKGWRFAIMAANSKGTLDIQSHGEVLFCPHCGVELAKAETEEIAWMEMDPVCEHFRLANLMGDLV